MTEPTGRGRGRPLNPRRCASYLGAELDRHLADGRITLTELASRVGVRADVPSGWRHVGHTIGCSNQRTIRPGTVGKIAAALGLDTADTQRLYMAAALDAGYQLQGYEIPDCAAETAI